MHSSLYVYMAKFVLVLIFGLCSHITLSAVDIGDNLSHKVQLCYLTYLTNFRMGQNSLLCVLFVVANIRTYYSERMLLLTCNLVKFWIMIIRKVFFLFLVLWKIHTSNISFCSSDSLVVMTSFVVFHVCGLNPTFFSTISTYQKKEKKKKKKKRERKFWCFGHEVTHLQHRVIASKYRKEGGGWSTKASRGSHRCRLGGISE